MGHLMVHCQCMLGIVNDKTDLFSVNSVPIQMELFTGPGAAF